MRSLLTFAPVLAALSACSPYQPDLGQEPFLCGDSAPICPENYTCSSDTTGQRVCTPNGSGSTVVDGGGSSMGECSDDSKLEPNDTIGTAFQTTVASSRASIDLADLAICPSGDIDNYAFSITVEQQNAVATVTYASAGAPLQMQILGSTGEAIDTAIGSGADTIVANAPNLSVGNYYVQVTGPTAGGENPNYELKLAVTGP